MRLKDLGHSQQTQVLHCNRKHTQQEITDMQESSFTLIYQRKVIILNESLPFWSKQMKYFSRSQICTLHITASADVIKSLHYIKTQIRTHEHIRWKHTQDNMYTQHRHNTGIQGLEVLYDFVSTVVLQIFDHWLIRSHHADQGMLLDFFIDWTPVSSLSNVHTMWPWSMV